MKFKNERIKKIVRWLLLFVIIIPVIVIIFISPITKYLVEKYDVKYMGREVKIDWAYVNPFTGYVYFNELKIYESKSDSVFFSANGVSADFAVLKLLAKTYEISSLTLNEPKGIIIQNKKSFNLDDLIERFSSKEDTGKTKEPTRFSILSIKINKGTMYYRETTTPVSIFISKLEIESPGIRWNSDAIATKYSFVSGDDGGDLRGEALIDTKNLDYRFTAVVEKLDLYFINQYLKDLTNYGNFRASLNASLSSSGNLHDAEDIDTRGKMEFNEFHFGKDSLDDYAAFKKLVIDMEQVYPRNKIYQFDSILLEHPYFKYEVYDHLNNIETMFGKNGSIGYAVNGDPEKFNLVLEIGKYLQRLSQNFLASDYHIKKLAISNGDMQYNDYSMNEKFSISADPLFVTADSIDKDRKWVKVNFTSSFKPYGSANVVLSINPKDSSDFDMNYHFQKVSAAMFNPYMITYTSFPLDRGTIELKGDWSVRNGMINSRNHLLVIDPRISKRIRKKDSKWVPLPLVMAFVRERGNVIDYEIPISGNLRDPKFKWRDVLVDLVENIFVKPPTTPYSMEVRNVENEVERSLNIKWEMRQCVLQKEQKKFVRKMADHLKDDATSYLSVFPMIFIEKERENILFFEAKKKYYLMIHAKEKGDYDERDSASIEKMSIKDKEFVKYITKFCSDSMLFTIQQKCYRYIGSDLVNLRSAQLQKRRANEFLNYFLENGTSKQLNIQPAENTVPYNGFSYFKIKYKGEIPETLKEAYEYLERMNEKVPRNKYLKLRKKSAGVLAAAEK